MYIPAAFKIEDRAAQHAFLQQHSFATLITTDAEDRPFATHLPFVLDVEAGEAGTLRAHIARANPQWQHFREGREVLVIFQGPHAYISPSWYETQPAVPTWNYAAVHAYGVPHLLDAEGLKTLLYATVALYEGVGEEEWKFEMGPEYVEQMMRGIVGFEIPLTRLEGKMKLSQNRSETDRRQVIAALRASGRPGDAEMAALMLLPTESEAGLS
jgi:transcriptional regulator